ncbi:MAG: PqqD family protein [Oscillospiraceae bacterium]|nr:PqqD family protein [Oscillospiraceae bacterium]
MSKQKDNFLDYIPKHNSLFPYEKTSDGFIEIKMQNKGLVKKLTQVIMKKPKFTYVKLERFGSFVWEQIDGKRNVYDIGQLVKEHFGDDAEPVYERLCQYIKSLRTNGFIVYQNLIKDKE